MNVLTKGSLSVIMYSSLLSWERSRASAGRLKRDFHRVVLMNWRSGRRRVGRNVGDVNAPEVVEV